MSGAMNRLMAGYAQANPVPRPRDDWAAHLGTVRPPDDGVDQNMIAYPPNYPGYTIPNVSQGNLNQAPGQIVGGYLPAAATQAAPDPNDPRYLEWLLAMRQRAGL